MLLRGQITFWAFNRDLTIYPDRPTLGASQTGKNKIRTVCTLEKNGCKVLRVQKKILLGQIRVKMWLKVTLKSCSWFQPDFVHLVPPLVQFCANSPDVKPHHLESLEYVFIGAAPVGEALASKFKEKAPQCQFREGIFESFQQSSWQFISRFC